MSNIDVFVSFDLDHDADLYELLLAQSRAAGFGFAVSGCSEFLTGTDLWSDSVRRRIREADQMIVICGEHTEASTTIDTELSIARQEQTPYILLWGRRETMCTKPTGAKPAEGMYGWTQQILQDRIDFTLRNARTDATPQPARDATRRG
jgi:hypothetical protein